MTDVRPPTETHMQWMRNVATSFTRTYPDLDAEDLFQNLCLWWFDKYHVISTWATDDQLEENKAYILRCLTNAASGFCKNELRQVAALRPKPDDAYYYSRKLIMEMLPFVESPESWSSLAVKETEPGAKPDPALGNNMLAHYADLTSGWGQLASGERRVLRLRFVVGLESEEIADLITAEGGEGMTGVAVRKRIERSVSKLQKIMGGERRARMPVDREERRRVVSNATAQVMTRAGYDGE